MSTHSESPLVAKIRKLMAKANDSAATEAEAATFAAKVQELLVANGLSMDSVREVNDAERGAIDRYSHDQRKNKWISPSRQALLRAVCHYYMCEAVSPGRGSTQWTIVGRPHNVTVAVEMTDYLVKTTVRISNRWGRENIGMNVIDFRKGCMARLAERLNKLRKEQTEQKPEYKPSGNPGNLPALFASERQQIGQVLKTMGVTYKSARPIRAGEVAAAAGRAAAEGISLHQQVVHGGGRLQISKR